MVTGHELDALQEAGPSEPLSACVVCAAAVGGVQGGFLAGRGADGLAAG